jgi:hypothetical protein
LFLPTCLEQNEHRRLRPGSSTSPDMPTAPIPLLHTARQARRAVPLLQLRLFARKAHRVVLPPLRCRTSTLHRPRSSVPPDKPATPSPLLCTAGQARSAALPHLHPVGARFIGPRPRFARLELDLPTSSSIHPIGARFASLDFDREHGEERVDLGRVASGELECKAVGGTI